MTDKPLRIKPHFGGEGWNDVRTTEFDSQPSPSRPQAEACPTCKGTGSDPATGIGDWDDGCRDCNDTGVVQPEAALVDELEQRIIALSHKQICGFDGFSTDDMAAFALKIVRTELAAERTRVKQVEAERQWVSVSERLPEMDEEVLWWRRRIDGESDYLFGMRPASGDPPSMYTHWLLPTPPEGSKP